MVGYEIRGGNRLAGELRVQGAKNSILPILASSILIHNKILLQRCHAMQDVQTALNILVRLGAVCVSDEDTVIVDTTDVAGFCIDDSLMCQMRSSVLFLGPLLARFGKAEIGIPGGCDLGSRPIDFHLSGLAQMGVRTQRADDRFVCTAPDGIHGAVIRLPFPSVGTTENLILAAVTARGETVLYGCAAEPEIVDLADFLNTCGARIEGAGSTIIRIQGVKHLHWCAYTVMPDRMATVTYLSAVAMTGGTVLIKDAAPHHVQRELELLTQMGCSVDTQPNQILLQAPGSFEAAGRVETGVYPAFPTDSGPLMVPLFCRANGETELIERVFDRRFAYVRPLQQFGCCLTQNDRSLVCRQSSFVPANVSCTDLRGGAALVLASLWAEGVSHIDQICHIQRGYFDLPRVLGGLGASIKEVDFDEENR